MKLYTLLIPTTMLAITSSAFRIDLWRDYNYQGTQRSFVRIIRVPFPSFPFSLLPLTIHSSPSPSPFPSTSCAPFSLPLSLPLSSLHAPLSPPTRPPPMLQPWPGNAADESWYRQPSRPPHVSDGNGWGRGMIC